MVFYLAKFFDLTVSVQVIFVPLNHFFGMESKKKRSDDVDSADSHFVWHIWHIASVMAADLFEIFLDFFQ